jgi:hypothetical protein
MMSQIVQKHFRPTTGRFLAALRRALPGLPQEELMWRVHFMVGAMAHTMCGEPVFTGSVDATADYALRMQRLVTFLSAGFLAPAAGEDK